jgi:hypothetical protein
VKCGIKIDFAANLCRKLTGKTCGEPAYPGLSGEKSIEELLATAPDRAKHPHTGYGNLAQGQPGPIPLPRSRKSRSTMSAMS